MLWITFHLPLPSSLTQSLPLVSSSPTLVFLWFPSHLLSCAPPHQCLLLLPGSCPVPQALKPRWPGHEISWKLDARWVMQASQAESKSNHSIWRWDHNIWRWCSIGQSAPVGVNSWTRKKTSDKCFRTWLEYIFPDQFKIDFSFIRVWSRMLLKWGITGWFRRRL